MDKSKMNLENSNAAGGHIDAKSMMDKMAETGVIDMIIAEWPLTTTETEIHVCTTHVAFAGRFRLTLDRLINISHKLNPSYLGYKLLKEKLDDVRITPSPLFLYLTGLIQDKMIILFSAFKRSASNVNHAPLLDAINIGTGRGNELRALQHLGKRLRNHAILVGVDEYVLFFHSFIR
jgi:hypothetical protein